MDLNTTKEDMLERFKLYGEIYCLLADINEDKRSMDGFVLEFWELEDMLEDEDIDLEFDFGEATGELYELDPGATVLLDVGGANLIEAGSVKEMIAMEAVVIE